MGKRGAYVSQLDQDISCGRFWCVELDDLGRDLARLVIDDCLVSLGDGLHRSSVFRMKGRLFLEKC